MRVGIISDTHDRMHRTVQAMHIFETEKVSAVLHCGDLTTAEIVHACGVLPSYFVLGNNDYQETRLRAAIEAVGGTYLGFGGVLELGGRRIGLTHGDDLRLYRSLLREKPDYLMFGHSHVKEDSRESGTRRINPGALHRASQYTVAVLDLVSDELRYFVIEA
jgi:putative phosphoesterase